MPEEYKSNSEIEEEIINLIRLHDEQNDIRFKLDKEKSIISKKIKIPQNQALLDLEGIRESLKSRLREVKQNIKDLKKLEFKRKRQFKLSNSEYLQKVEEHKQIVIEINLTWKKLMNFKETNLLQYNEAYSKFYKQTYE